MFVETHAHLLADDLQKYPIGPVGGQQSEWSKGISLTAEAFLAHMDAAGVDQAVLVQASTVHGYDNNYCAESASRYPARFASVCCIDPLLPDAPQTLNYWITQRGMDGVRLFTTGSSVAESHWLDSPATYPFWDRARELGIPVDVQIRATGIPMLRNVLDRYGDVRMILDHLASPAIEDGPPYAVAADLFDLGRYPNMYFKFSTHNIEAATQGKSTVDAFFRTAIERLSANHLLWSSNFPGTRGSGAEPYKELVDFARNALADLPESDRNWLFGETARSLYPKLGG